MTLTSPATLAAARRLAAAAALVSRARRHRRRAPSNDDATPPPRACPSAVSGRSPRFPRAAWAMALATRRVGRRAFRAPPAGGRRRWRRVQVLDLRSTLLKRMPRETGRLKHLVEVWWRWRRGSTTRL
jgi:hypothetical protein